MMVESDIVELIGVFMSAYGVGISVSWVVRIFVKAASFIGR